MCQFGQGHKYGPATNSYNAIRPRLTEPSNMMFNRQVHGIMPVSDCKPIGQDCDDDNHNKLVDRQQSNSNDTSPVLAYIPIGSTVAVQQEDSGLWTHGTVVGTGNHNHNDRSYMIQLTTNGRCITYNRQHIKATTITADAYLQYQSTKQSHTRTDPLVDILNNINKNSAAYVTTIAPSNNSHSGQYHELTNTSQKEKAKDKEQYNTVADTIKRQERINGPIDKRTMLQGSKVIKTRSG